MTYRDLFHEIMFYGEFDHMPVIHWTGWEETMERWYAEGLPRDANIHEYLGTTPHWTGVGVNLDLYPAFDEEVLEDTPEYRIFRQRAQELGVPLTYVEEDGIHDWFFWQNQIAQFLRQFWPTQEKPA